MLIDYVLGQTSVILRVKILNSATGNGLTGLTNTSTALIISTIADNEASATAYTSAGSTIDSITTLGTYATPTTNHCSFKEIDATNHPGLYEVQLANARFNVASAKSLVVCIPGGATNSGGATSSDCDCLIPLRSVNPYDGVRNGMSALPNATAGGASGLPTLDASSHLLVYSVNQGVTVSTNNDKTGYSLSQSFPSNFASLSINAGDGGVVVHTNNDKTGYTASTVSDKTGYSLATAPPTAAAIATALWTDVTAGDFTVNGSPGKILTTNLDTNVGSRSTYAGADTSGTSTLLARLTSVRAGYLDNLTNLDATVSSRSTYSGGAVASVTAPVTAGTVTDKTGYSLAATGLDAISVADPGGVGNQTTFPKILVALYRRFFNKTTVTTSQLKTYGNDGTTVNTTQTVADDGTTQTVGAAT